MRPSSRLSLATLALVGCGVGEPSLATDVAALAPTCPTGIFGQRTPTTRAANDGAAVELGVRFATRGAVSVTGVRFYKGAGNTGPHVGHLWTIAAGSGAGQLLKTVTFTGETATGWQTALFTDGAILPSAGSPLFVSYLAPHGHYAADFGANGLAGGAGAPTGPVYALANGAGFVYGGGYPANTNGDVNYYVEPVVDDVTPPTAPAFLTATASGADATLQWTPGHDGAGELSTSAASQTVLRDGAAIATVAAGASTFTDHAVAAGVHQYAVTSTDFCANTSAPSNSASVTIAAGGPQTLFGNAAPTVFAATDTAPVELGVKLRSSAAGKITGIRFYRNVAIPAGYTVHLWTSTGTLLASATLIEGVGPTPGWQLATFAAPVAIAANTTYVASYFASQGGYSVEANGFATARQSGVLTGLASGASGGNGVFVYAAAGGFPTSTFNATNYFVDVTYVP
jgi:hypothetical protein